MQKQFNIKKMFDKKNIFIILGLFGIATASMAGEKIIAMGAASTIVVDLGKQSQIIATDIESTHRINSLKNVQNVGYIMKINAEHLLSLKADYIITDSRISPKPQYELLKKYHKNIYVVPAIKKIDDIYKRIEFVGNVLKIPKKAKKIVKNLKQQHTELNNELHKIKNKPSVMVIIAMAKGVIAINDKNRFGILVKMAGGNNILNKGPEYQLLSDEGIIQINPDVILVFSHNMSQVTIDELKQRPAINLTNAGNNNRIYKLDAESMLSFGIDTVQNAKKIAKILYPKRFK